MAETVWSWALSRQASLHSQGGRLDSLADSHDSLVVKSQLTLLFTPQLHCELHFCSLRFGFVPPEYRFPRTFPFTGSSVPHYLSHPSLSHFQFFSSSYLSSLPSRFQCSFALYHFLLLIPCLSSPCGFLLILLSCHFSHQSLPRICRSEAFIRKFFLVLRHHCRVLAPRITLEGVPRSPPTLEHHPRLAFHPHATQG